MSGERWLKLYTGLRTHPKWRLRLTSDTARVAYVMALMAAKEAGADGRFESRDHLALVLGEPYAGCVDELVDAGLIDELPDTGELWMHDFETRQAPVDPKAAERARRYRSKKGGGEGGNGTSPQVDKPVEKPSRRDATAPSRRDAPVTSRHRHAVTSRDANGTVTKKSRVTVREESRGDRDRSTHVSTARESEFDALVDALVMANVWTKPTPKMLAFLRSLIRDHGHPMVEEALRIEYPDGIDGLLARVGRRCRQWARERSEADERSRSESMARALKGEEERMATATLEEKERAAANRAALAAWAAGFGTGGADA